MPMCLTSVLASFLERFIYKWIRLVNRVLPARKVPVSVKEKFKAELQRLQDLEVIAPVDKPTKLVSQFVVAVK